MPHYFPRLEKLYKYNRYSKLMALPTSLNRLMANLYRSLKKQDDTLDYYLEKFDLSPNNISDQDGTPYYQIKIVDNDVDSLLERKGNLVDFIRVTQDRLILTGSKDDIYFKNHKDMKSLSKVVLKQVRNRFNIGEVF